MDITFDREMRKKVQQCKRLDQEITMLLHGGAAIKFDQSLLDRRIEQYRAISHDLISDLYDYIGEEDDG